MSYRPDLEAPEADPTELRPGEWTFDEAGRLWGRTPNGHIFHITPALWNISGPRDAPTATPSIRISNSHGELWHGFLTAGEFKPC